MDCQDPALEQDSGSALNPLRRKGGEISMKPAGGEFTPKHLTDSRDVQELMGHQSFETTLQYAHLSEEHVKRQVLRLPFANG